MITLSFDFGGLLHNKHQKKVSDLINTHLAFPGSEKLQMGLKLNDDGAAAVSFAGPDDVVSEAKRLWSEKGQPAVDEFRAKVQEVSAPVTKSVKQVIKAAKKTPVAKKTKKTVAKVVKKVAPKKATVKKAAPKKKVKVVAKKKAVAKKAVTKKAVKKAVKKVVKKSAAKKKR